MSRRRLRDALAEAALGFGTYGVHLLVRRFVLREAGRRQARRNAERLIALERRLGLDIESAFQRLVVDHRRVCQTLDAGYVTLNIVLTVGLPIVLWARDHPRFSWLRRSVVLSILGSNAIYVLVPCVPPRKLPGFADAFRVASWPDVDSGLVARLYNPIAAFPSMHLAFAVVTTAGARAVTSNRPVRYAALAYPPVVAFTVVATGNHLVIDVLAGTAVGLAVVRLSRLLGR